MVSEASPGSLRDGEAARQLSAGPPLPLNGGGLLICNMLTFSVTRHPHARTRARVPSVSASVAREPLI